MTTVYPKDGRPTDDREANILLYADRLMRGLDWLTGEPLPATVVADLRQMKARFISGQIRKTAKLRAVRPAVAAEVAGSGA